VTDRKICSTNRPQDMFHKQYYYIFITAYTIINISNVTTCMLWPQKCFTLFGTYIKDELLRSNFWHNLEAMNNLSFFKSFRIILITLYSLHSVPHTLVSSPKYPILPHVGNHWQEQQKNNFTPPPQKATITTSLLISNSVAQLPLNYIMDWKIQNSVQKNVCVRACTCGRQTGKKLF